ncbi:MAG: hypothetical protein U9Q19_02660 [Pseudomonadota bacterium]|nr:hypothetical protein [Pseudomonadota bacterium]
MAVSVVWKGNGRVNNADATTNWTALKISGTGGGPSAAAADGSLEGSGAVTCTVNKQRVALYYDIGAGNELDFTSGATGSGTAVTGEFVYVWISFLAAALLNNQSAGGIGIFLESSTPGTGQYHLWYFDGADTYAGGWKRLVLDPNETVSASAGTAIDLGAVRYFGVFGDVGATTARFDNLICDAIDVGTGLRVYGTGTTDDLMGDILTDEDTNRYGIVTALNSDGSAIELLGELDIGDDVGTNATTVTDVDKKIFAGNPEYYDGTSVTTPIPLTSMGLNCVGNATGATSITIGKKVGTGDTASGRNGYTIVGNATYTVGIDFDDGNVNTNKWYGTTFELLSGVLSWSNTSAHELIGSVFNDCAQFDPVGAIQMRAMTFVNYSGAADGALLWNESIDIKNSDFIANTRGVEHPSSAGTPYSYLGLTFSGNTNDVNNTSGSAITVSKESGSDPSSYDAGGSAVTFTANFTLTLTDLIDGTQVTIVNSATRTELQNSNATATGIITYSHSGGETVDILIIDWDYDPNVSSIYGLALPNASSSIKVGQIDDPNAVNP